MYEFVEGVSRLAQSGGQTAADCSRSETPTPTNTLFLGFGIEGAQGGHVFLDERLSRKGKTTHDWAVVEFGKILTNGVFV